MTETANAIGAIALVLYLLTGPVLMRVYVLRRHGSPMGWGWDAVEPGFLEALALAVVWPVAIFFSTVRNPDVCRHDVHVLTRHEMRCQLAESRAALRNARAAERDLR